MFKVFAYSTTLVLLSLGLLACGGGGGGSNTSAPDTGTASFGLSDAPVEGLSEVVITIDAMELRRTDGGECDNDPVTNDCVFIDEFTEKDEPDPVSTITVDLLDLQDGENQIIVQGLELQAGEYDQLRLSIIDEDINSSWVKETANGDVLKELKVPSDGLKLGGFTVESDGVQVFIIEFDLRKAMTYNPGPPGPDRYILKPTGVRVVEAVPAASIAGTVDPLLFSGNDTLPCSDKVDDTEGNVIYLYQGHDLDTACLADNFDEAQPCPNDPLANAIAPYTSQQVDADGSYGIYYLPAGDYTLAFSCEAVDDDPEVFDGIVIPSPDTEPDTTIVELSLLEGEDETCDLPVVLLVDGTCAPPPVVVP